MSNPLELLKLSAEGNFFRLRGNPYPGRGMVVGMGVSRPHLVQVYWIMGRSANSRNRIFVRGKDGRLFTEPVDASLVKEASLIIYNAMREVRHNGITFAIVSNGSQTDDVADGYAKDEGLEHSMHWNTYEPDNPNFTPRITASCYWLRKNHPVIRMAILRKSPWSDVCDRHLYEINDVSPGFGYCLHTYMGEGKPLPPFQGEPYIVPLYGDANLIANNFWEALDADNRVALAVKVIPNAGPSEMVIINKFSKAA